MSNFTHFPEEFSSLIRPAKKAERYVYDDPTACAFYCRKTLDVWVSWIYENQLDLDIPYNTSLSNLLSEPDFKNLILPDVLNIIHAIRKKGNRAVHNKSSKAPNREDTLHLLELTYGIVRYFVESYAEEYAYYPGFDEDKIPDATKVRDNKNKIRIKELIADLEKEKKLHKKTKEQQQKVQEAWERNKNKVKPVKDPDEALTRKIYIDTYLEEAGWDLSNPKTTEFQVDHFPNKSGKGYADYVLWGKDGKPLAVIEAKRTSRDPKAGRHQAELYAKSLEQRYGQRPDVFLSNGYKIFFNAWKTPLREVRGFYTQNELQLDIDRRTTRRDLGKIEIKDRITDRYYQKMAIRRVGERLENQHRGALLVMATGTGKTRTAASLVDVLARGNWIKNVLFLADRTALVRQAKNSFNTHLPDFPAVNLVEEKEESNSRIVFSTYQTMINLIDEVSDEDGRFYGVGHFDLIIFDEIHRSIYNKYRAIFEYFDGYKVGLTATPRQEHIDRNTYDLFGLEPGNPTYNYDYAQAVADNYLEDYYSLSVKTKFRRTGIKYDELSDEEKREYEEKFADPMTGEIPDEVEASALDDWIYNKGTADLILDELMTRGIKVNNDAELGKTIIFTRKHAHAVFLEDVFNANYPQYKGEFLKVIDYQSEHSASVLEDFKIKNKNPVIACSVDMLDTGIDVPEAVNLVFLKPVKSHIKFWQMIGRGTRKCPDLLGDGKDKDEFLILDFCRNFEYFSLNQQQKEGKRQPTVNERLFLIRLKLSQILLEQANDGDMVKFGKQLIEILHKQVVLLHAEGKDSFLVRRHLKVVETFIERSAWEDLTSGDMRQLKSEIAPMTYDNETDKKAKLFDLLIYDLMLDVVSGGTHHVKLIEKVRGSAEKLQKKNNIPAVQKKLSFLQKIAQEEYWKQPTAHLAEKVRTEIRDLMKYLDKPTRDIVVTGFTDEILGVAESPAVYETESFDKAAYKKKVEQYVREHKHNITIDKLRKNKPVTEDEIEALENMLFEQGDLGTKEQFEGVYGERPLGHFIRSLLGLQKEAAQEAFSALINDAGLNAKQVEFLNMIINHFVQNGKLTADKLFEPPFTNVDNRGVIHLFGKTKAQEIQTIINTINKNGEVG